MSSVARKRSGLAIPPGSPRLQVVPDTSFREVFGRVFQTLQHMLPQGDLLIGVCATLGETLRVELASGSFASLRGSSLAVRGGPLANLLVGLSSYSICRTVDLTRDEKAFASLSGESLLLRVDLAGDLVVVIVYSQEDSIETERIEALKSIADLAGQAACSSDLVLDVQAQQLHLDTLRGEIEEVQQFYRQFSDAIQQCFWVLDIPNERVLVVSENFERVWGAEKQILFKGLTGFMDNVLPGDRDRVLSEFHTRLGHELDTELRVIDASGEIRWIWLRGFPTGEFLQPAAGGSPEVCRVVLIADDITEKKVEEERVREREAELVSRARVLAVSDLASGVAHEINNPLTIIVGRAAEIKNAVSGSNDTAGGARVHDLADKIQKVSVRISEIISNLKALSRQEKSVMHPFSVERLFAELKDMTTERFRVAGVGLTVCAAPSLLVEMNSTLVSQLLLNLLNNSFDAIQVETEKWVKLEFTEDDDSIYFFVTDSGPGIPIKNRSRIFDPFFTTKSPGKGTGLGLSLAASIAAHHNGALRLDTMHPHTRFVVQLPKKQVARLG